MISMRTNDLRRGSTLVEFTLAGIPLIFMMYATVQLSLAMWNYDTLAYAVKQGARYAALRGQGCTTNGNTCSVTVGQIAGQIESAAIGLPADQVNVTLTTASGQAQPCNPLNSCDSNTAVWPPAANNDNRPGKDVTISAQYLFPSALAMFWPSAGAVKFGAIALPAKSTQQILF
jgi:Flp pilus assembly protein TadG